MPPRSHTSSFLHLPSYFFHPPSAISHLQRIKVPVPPDFKAWATEGHSVAIPGLGTMRFGLRSESVADVNDVATKMITSRRIVFTPSVGLKQELKQTSIAITCYDKDGNIIKRVTSDAGEVEDPENEGGDNTNQGGSQQGGSQSGNTNTNTDPDQGGGDNTSGGFDEG